MKDFLKIFFILCLIVASFFWGRNFGENSSQMAKEAKLAESEIAKNQQAQEEIHILKEKIQNLLDSSDLKKVDDLLGKIMTLFLVDLGLRVSNDRLAEFEQTKTNIKLNCNQLSEKPMPPTPSTPLKHNSEPELDHNDVAVKTKTLPFNVKQFKSNEWILQNAEDNNQIWSSLKKLELKSLNPVLDGATDSKIEDVKNYKGEYRGNIIDQLGNNYATLVIKIHTRESVDKPIYGQISITRNGKNESTSTFQGADFAYKNSEINSLFVQMGSSRFLQLYKLESQNKIAGYLYERMVNTTTNTIGRFVLVNTDLN